MRSFIELLCCVILVPQLLFVVCDLVFLMDQGGALALVA